MSIWSAYDGKGGRAGDLARLYRSKLTASLIASKKMAQLLYKNLRWPLWERNDVMEKQSKEKTYEATAEDPPPSYDTVKDESANALLRSSHEDDSGAGCQIFTAGRSWGRKLLADFLPKIRSRPGQPSANLTKGVQLFLPDPKHVKCRCGQYNDTTISDEPLPAGRVKCRCGYIVSSTGQAHSPPRANTSRSPEHGAYTCSCGTSDRRDRDGKIVSVCRCGAEFRPNGMVERLCPFHNAYALDARNVRCKCDKYVDTTMEWIVKHRKGKYSWYDYALPSGSGRCVCGMTVGRDATCVQEHQNSCCEVLSQKRKEVQDGSLESCSWTAGFNDMNDLSEKAQSLPKWHRNHDRSKSARLKRRPLVVITSCIILLLVCDAYIRSLPIIDRRPAPSSEPRLVKSLLFERIPERLEHFQNCSISNLARDTDFDFLSTAHPLSLSEFVSRRDRLVQALATDGLDAFLVEPGYTFSYYVNITQKDWEEWEPEERPFLMVVRPERVGGEVKANTSFLVPSFEAERARLLHMPFRDPIETVTYEEHWNPYLTLLDSLVFAALIERGSQPKIMVDDEMRDFISRGLADNGFDVVGLDGEVERARQTKSEAEIGILRAVNTGTVEALRAVRKCLAPGLTEDDVMMVLDNTMRSAGLEPFFDIVLFDEDASNPHGGTDGNKKLENETMVLIDVGAHLYGYSSDICRSFFPPFLPQPTSDEDFEDLSGMMKEKLKVWDIVFEAQTASLDTLHENSTAAAVDIAARDVISGAGYGEAFTHRVGHGIGIKAHESPYLNKGNVNTTLKAGMTFTSEPGIYLVDKFGVRHEDVLMVKENGLPDILTGQRARDAWNP